ncbi:MAG: T9SS type B sorting domain-containing protein [Flavobacteriales bacterium]|nr:T9SS type B sorting domain-containing protein [Flavobacteriales bacterium]
MTVPTCLSCSSARSGSDHNRKALSTFKKLTTLIYRSPFRRFERVFFFVTHCFIKAIYQLIPHRSSIGTRRLLVYWVCLGWMKLVMRFLLYIMAIVPSLSCAQICSNSIVPPATINGVDVTATYSGSVSFFGTSYSSCGLLYTTPPGSIHIGEGGAYEYTFNFSIQVNDIDFVLTATGNDANEVFTFTTNAGIPTIIDHGSCFTTVSANVITSGLGAPSSSGGGGGIFTVTNSEPFSSLTVSGDGGSAGSLLAVCSSSIVPAVQTVEICTGDSMLLAGMYQYETGLYSDTIHGGSVNGNDSIAITYLVVNPVPSVNLGQDTSLCIGDSLAIDAMTNGATYVWQDGSENAFFEVTHQGTYWVEVTIENCSSVDTLNVAYNELPTDVLGNDTVVCLGKEFLLDATIPGATYLWQDNSMNPTLVAVEDGVYWVELSLNNCSVSDTVTVHHEICDPILLIPNVFTPNKDGINELFTPETNLGIAEMRTAIYNRWGRSVFKSNDLTIDWNGDNVDAGTYFYIITYVDFLQNVGHATGYVTIVK